LLVGGTAGFDASAIDINRAPAVAEGSEDHRGAVVDRQLGQDRGDAVLRGYTIAINRLAELSYPLWTAPSSAS
jgi:hypothetical protein